MRLFADSGYVAGGQLFLCCTQKGKKSKGTKYANREPLCLGLTDTHPTLTTYFEGEIIGPHYSFLTQHPQWGANDKVDISHWRKFDEFKPYARAAPRGGVQIRDVASKPHIFMRWKEQFLVPNHRVRTINGASFEGFYYICFSQIEGTIEGIYFHSKSEK